MMPFIQQSMYYGIVIFIVVFIIAFYLRGFLFKYVKVRGSKGRLLLVNVGNKASNYYSVGTIDENTLVFVDKKKERHLITNVGEKGIYNLLGVQCIDVDEDKNFVIQRDGNNVIGFDAIRQSHLHERALMKPEDINKNIWFIIIAIGILIVLILAIIILVKVNQIMPAINSLKQIVAINSANVTMV